ncbi:hypothetical protein [Gorillibacterium timonense]|uniref:hypothetical protein n=1 Tax=Gorillibacterium timonense TaxID=1689269 RepID=UPI001F1C321C|nr:hypothetical protein [Gorillibacterium timonense]
MTYIKFTSENTLDHVSLHDCVIYAISFKNQSLSVLFEHIDVLSTHPRNNTGKAMYTGKAILKFIDFEILESFLYDTSEIEGKKRIIVEGEVQKRVIDISELLIDFEVLKNEEVQTQDNYCIHRFDGSTSLKYNADFGYWIIKYKTLIIEWDELIDTAWFEDR